MRLVKRYVRNRLRALSFLRILAFVVCATMLYKFGEIFMMVAVELRVALLVAFMTMGTGYLNIYYGIKARDRTSRKFGVFVLTVGVLLLEFVALCL